MESKLDALLQRFSAIPTRIDLFVGLALVFAIFAMLIGGLGWLETRASRVQTAAPPAAAPVLIQLPSPWSPPKGK
jgi:hypothetical protein